MSATDERYVAKVTVLSELVRHHVGEEESDLFPMVRSAIGQLLLALSNVGFALRMIGFAVVFTILVISANTMIMSVFTRIREIAILRVNGFSSRQVAVLILGAGPLAGSGHQDPLRARRRGRAGRSRVPRRGRACWESSRSHFQSSPGRRASPESR